MSAIGDALTALKNVVLMEERLSIVQADIRQLVADVKGLNDYAVSLDKRLVRIETMIEMSGRKQSQIEGQ